MWTGLIFVTLAFTAFFAASETAFVSANRLKAELEASRLGYLGGIVASFLTDRVKLLTTTLVGATLSLILYANAVTLFLAPWASQITESEWGLLLIEIGFGTLLLLLLGELLPKTFAQERANQLVFVFAIPLWLTYWGLIFIIKPTIWLSHQVAKRFQVEAEGGVAFERQDFEHILMTEVQNEAPSLPKDSPSNKIDDEERELVSNVLELRETRVRDVMVPRTQIKAIKKEASISQAIELFSLSGHSKLPVYAESLDHIEGFIFIHDLFHTPQTLAEIIRPIHFVSETKRSSELLREFLEAKNSMVMVYDEHGGISGLVTIEDLLEELIGEIEDEHDTCEYLARALNEHTWMVSGGMEIEALAEQFGIELEEGDYDTLGGYLLANLGQIPKKDTIYTLARYQFQILKSTAKRIELVEVTRLKNQQNA